MQHSDALYMILEYENCDVAIPFVCHLCAACCGGWTWPLPIPSDMVPVLARTVGRPVAEIEGKLQDFYKKAATGEPVDCIFLENAGMCAVYPCRPDPCRQFPLFTPPALLRVSCPGLKEHRRAIETLSSLEGYVRQHEPQSCSRTLRYPPPPEWHTLWTTFLKAHLSSLSRQAFLRMNQPIS